MDQWTEGPIQPNRTPIKTDWSGLAKGYLIAYGVWVSMATYMLVGDGYRATINLTGPATIILAG